MVFTQALKRRKKYAITFWIILFNLFGLSTYAQKIDSAQTIPDTLLFKIQKAQSLITEVNSANKKGYNLQVLSSALAGIQTSINPLKEEFKQKKTVIDAKSLLSYELILKDASQRLTKLREILVKHTNDLQAASEQVVGLSSDTLFAITSVGVDEKRYYQSQLLDIKNRLQRTGETTGANLEGVSRLLAEVSATDISVNDLRTQVAERLEQSGRSALGREAPLIWQVPWFSVNDGDFLEHVRTSYLGQKQILSYFIESTWDKRVLTLLFALAFFFWVHRNFKLAKRPAVTRKLGELRFEYLKPFPVLATVIVGLSIIPLFEQGAPSLYIELLQLALLLSITIHLRKVLPANQLKGWILLVFTFTVLVVISSVNSTGSLLRLLLIAANIFFVYLGFRLYGKLKIPQFPKKYTRFVLIVLMGFNVLSIILNVFGRISLAKAISLTGVVGLVQFIGLAVFVQLVLDALELQLKISSCSKGFFSRVSHNRTRATVKKLLLLVSILLWIIVFLINMNMTSGTLSFFDALLAKERSFGSIRFTLGNILFFVVIIYVANKLQKNVPILFGEGNLSYEGQVEQKSSKVALIRLIIIVLALLLAITASGLPMDRVTVVLGALGVGIGLGMQNIVNNFVSGIILIFERPFRIGDFVELADKKGRVKDIGIRSSKLVTQQGSEVIIPNGDLLSGRLVNWTLSHDYVKTEFLFKVNVATDLEVLKKVIEQEVSHTEHAMDKMPTEVLVNGITAGAIEIKVMAWVGNIYVEPSFRSDLMRRLLTKFNEIGIQIA